jgi:hypothetical protein
MIGASPTLTARSALSLKNPVSALSGLSKPRTIADSTTESASNNVIAQGYQKGNARGAMNSNDRAGFSRGAMDRMRAGQAEAAGIAEGANAAAGIRGEDQAFNENQQSTYEQMVDDRLNHNFGIQTSMNSANFGLNMSKQRNNAALAQARARARMSLRLALLSKLA